MRPISPVNLFATCSHFCAAHNAVTPATNAVDAFELAYGAVHPAAGRLAAALAPPGQPCVNKVQATWLMLGVFFGTVMAFHPLGSIQAIGVLAIGLCCVWVLTRPDH